MQRQGSELVLAPGVELAAEIAAAEPLGKYGEFPYRRGDGTGQEDAGHQAEDDHRPPKKRHHKHETLHHAVHRGDSLLLFGLGRRHPIFAPLVLLCHQLLQLQVQGTRLAAHLDHLLQLRHNPLFGEELPLDAGKVYLHAAQDA